MLYDYLCKKCSHEFATEQSIKDDPLKRCPKCDKYTLQRLITNGNFVLKGDGWYRDGYTKNMSEK